MLQELDLSGLLCCLVAGFTLVQVLDEILKYYYPGVEYVCRILYSLSLLLKLGNTNSNPNPDEKTIELMTPRLVDNVL